MLLMISYQDGRLVEAIVLAAGMDRMRVSIPDIEDAVELRNIGDGWISERGERVEIEAIIAGADLSSPLREIGAAVAGCGVIE